MSTADTPDEVTSQDADLVSFPLQRTCPYRPAAEYAGLREQEDRLQKVRLYDGETAWVATHYGDIRALLADDRLSSNRALDGFPKLSPRVQIAQAYAAKGARLFLMMDDPEHHEHRKALLHRFTVRKIAEMRPLITEVVSARIDAMLTAGPPANLITDLGFPVAATTIGHLLGVSNEDLSQFLDRFTRFINAQNTADAGQATVEVIGYVNGLIERKAADPQDDLLSTLAVEQLATGKMTQSDLLWIAALMMFAGQETAANTISLGTLTLLEHPDQLALFKEGKVEVGTVVEELLRFLSVAELVPRVAKADIPVGDQVIRAGEGVLISVISANHDPDFLPDAGRLDVTRSENRHMAFGHGIHTCIGQNLARLEIDIALTQLFSRIPDLRLAEPVDELPIRDSIEVQGVVRMPITW